VVGGTDVTATVVAARVEDAAGGAVGLARRVVGVGTRTALGDPAALGDGDGRGLTAAVGDSEPPEVADVVGGSRVRDGRALREGRVVGDVGPVSDGSPVRVGMPVLERPESEGSDGSPVSRDLDGRTAPPPAHAPARTATTRSPNVALTATSIVTGRRRSGGSGSITRILTRTARSLHGRTARTSCAGAAVPASAFQRFVR
jgi:hypothetical protein